VNPAADHLKALAGAKSGSLSSTDLEGKTVSGSFTC